MERDGGINIAPFHAGQNVIATNAVVGSAFKNGTHYVVTACVYQSSGNPISPPGAKYWYVGIRGHANGGAYFDPKIFSPIEQKEFPAITFSEIVETEKLEILIAN